MDKDNGPANDISKLQDNLSLLRTEYAKLQTKYNELEREHAIVVASLEGGEDSFIFRILKAISNLCMEERYSDLSIHLDTGIVPAHKFVLLARSQSWGVPNLSETDKLDWSHFKQNVGTLLLKWIYTNFIESTDLECILSLMKVGNEFKLTDLVMKCEGSLISSVDRINCVKLYMTAIEISASRLIEHCSAVMSTHWNDFTKEDFNCVPADIMYQVLKSNSKFPLHDAIRIERRDVVLKLLENNKPSELNRVDDKGGLPLDISLQTKQEDIAIILASHGANLNAVDNDGHSLLHKSVLRCDDDAVKFLLDHGAEALPSGKTGETPMHVACTLNNSLRCAEHLLAAGCAVNIQRLSDGKTALHICVDSKNEEVLKLILNSKSVDLQCTSNEGDSALWLALKRSDTDEEMKNFAEILVHAGASPNEVSAGDQNSLLHRCAEERKEIAGIFLCRFGANVNHLNTKGESPLHTACRVGLPLLVSELLKHEADPTIRDSFSWDTALHIAIKRSQCSCAHTILDQVPKQKESKLAEILNIKDSDGLTPLGVSLRMKSFDLATTLVQNGSDVNAADLEGKSLLNRFIVERIPEAVTFLLDHNATCNPFEIQSHTSSLLLAVEHSLPTVVEALCKKGFDMSVTDSNGDCLLWVALKNSSIDIASILVRFGIDTDFWSQGPDGQLRTLLHRSIMDKSEDIACFLIQAGCDVNASGDIQKDLSDLPTPLCLCADLGLTATLTCLLDHGAQINLKGPSGKTPLHIAIQGHRQEIVKLLLDHPATDLSIRDNLGYSPFATAMLSKNNKAAQFILSKYPSAAEQYSARGKNFLHESISEVNVESVMFLLSIKVDVNSRTKDSNMFSSLHLAVIAKSELLVRNLLLAGANIDDRTPQKRTALHITAEKGDANIVSVLLDNGADITAVDNEHNNALSIAVKNGNYQVCKVLLLESHIDAESVNLKGQNSLHLLARYGKENAVDILNLFLECMPQYPINKADVDGNTPLLLAYINGNGDLCRAFVKNNAALGAMNKDGITIFNYQVPTRQLLYRLLDYLTEEPPWVEGDVCLECGSKFSITVRKHHWHCGRILCNSCSGKDIPIVKFNINKPVRVCSPCFDVLALGGAMV